MTQYAANGRYELGAARHETAAHIRAVVGRLDWILLLVVAGVVGYGLWAIDGVTRFEVPGDPDFYVQRQAVYALIGAVGMLVAIFIDPNLYRRATWVLFGVTIAMLLLVAAVGTEIRGSQRWLDIGSFRFQPSEFGKVLVVLVLAGFLANRAKGITESRTVFAVSGLALVPMILVFFQPDIGSALVYGAALAGVLLFAGVRWVDLALLLSIVVAVALFALWGGPKLGIVVLEPYQTERLTAFINPSDDPADATYNVNQSILAVGAGGFDGRGVAGSTQTNLDYVPENPTDFVFASLAEQRGFFGVSILLFLYLLIVWRALRVITVARNAFAAMVAGGIVVALLFQTAINIGMTIGMAPVTGIPLPFVSAGGSSLIANLFAIGILQAIYARRP